MLVALQLAGVAVTPLNLTVLVPCVAPKFAPLIVTDVPTAPEDGVRPVMLAGGGFPPPLPAPLQPTIVNANVDRSAIAIFNASARLDLKISLIGKIVSIFDFPVQVRTAQLSSRKLRSMRVRLTNSKVPPKSGNWRDTRSEGCLR
jgi:hypothetical protein